MDRKVLFTASTYSHIVNFHLPYLRKFRGEGWTVHAACGGKAMDIPYADEAIGLPFEKSMGSPKNFKAAAILREKIRREGYDLIITHTSLAAFFTRLALWGLKERPLVANMVHGYLFDDDTPRPKRDLLLTAERWMASVTDLVLTMNRWDYETAVRYDLGHKVVQVPGVGVDFSRFDEVPLESRQALRRQLNVPENAFVLIYAAEFSKNKSQSILIRAMGRLPENIVLILAGNGTILPACKKLAQQLNISHRIIFPGYLKNIISWYRIADLAVASSRKEGLPFNIMEAMYAGLPVVASDVKGHSDLISDGETGLLYPYGDEKACSEQILKLLDSEELRQRLAGNARKNVTQYGLERVLPRVWAEYCTLLEQKVVVSK